MRPITSPVASQFREINYSVSCVKKCKKGKNKCKKVIQPQRGGNVQTLLLQQEAYQSFTLFPANLNVQFDMSPFL